MIFPIPLLQSRGILLVAYKLFPCTAEEFFTKNDPDHNVIGSRFFKF